ncbi:MAG: ribonuclease P protein subunit [Promethearchaeota archaeon]
MRYNPKIFIYQDLIGEEIYAKSKSNPNWVEFRKLGVVMDETKHTLCIQNMAQSSQVRKYVKDQYIFQCWLPQADGSKFLLEFDGSKIDLNPENRIKQLKKKKWRKLH